MEHKSFITFYKFPVTAFLQFYLAFEDNLRLATFIDTLDAQSCSLFKDLGFITTSDGVFFFYT